MILSLSIGGKFLKEVTREEYIKNITDYEKLHLIIVEDDRIFLRADIENAEELRIEMMYLEMDTLLNFTNANSECRNCGGKIYFWETDEENVIEEFLNIAPYAIYLICAENDLKNILPTYKNKSIYILTANL